MNTPTCPNCGVQHESDEEEKHTDEDGNVFYIHRTMCYGGPDRYIVEYISIEHNSMQYFSPVPVWNDCEWWNTVGFSLMNERDVYMNRIREMKKQLLAARSMGLLEIYFNA